MTARGLIIGAPSTGSGKTTITLGLLRALSRAGKRVAPAKIGPDYIDPQFHAAAAGRSSVNLDAWAMRPTYLAHLFEQFTADADLTIVEGVMGVFDGGQRPGRTGHGSTADLARLTGLPIVLVVNCGGLAQSVAPLVHGFQTYADDVSIAGVILNNTSSDRHREMLTTALEKTGIHVFGAIPRDKAVALPSRHLGLKQAEEHDDLDELLERMADLIEQNCNMDALISATRETTIADTSSVSSIPPMGQRIAVARDVAFRFAYPHLLQGWRDAGAELSFFSPLADEPAPGNADAIYLPGGYPELHGPQLANANAFKSSVRNAASRNIPIFGECGGYMVLGNTIIDADGTAHEMLGLLDLETSFAARKFHLGYRHVRANAPFGLGSASSTFFAHEFHYASITREEGHPLFTNIDIQASSGLHIGSVAGSFIHLIDIGD